MATVRVCRVVEAEAGKLFDALADWGNWAEWCPMLAGSELVRGASRTAGALRRVGPGLEERLTGCDEDAGLVRYVIEDPSLLGVRTYRAEVRLLPLTDRAATVVDWVATYDAEGDGEEQARTTFEGFYNTFIDDLATHLAT